LHRLRLTQAISRAQYDKTEEFLERAVAAAPDYETAHDYLGLALALGLALGRLGATKIPSANWPLPQVGWDAARKKGRSSLHFIDLAQNQQQILSDSLDLPGMGRRSDCIVLMRRSNISAGKRLLRLRRSL
jgi:hypothetical protein